MAFKINPFKPHTPVPAEMFAGRKSERTRLDKGLFQTKNGQGCNFLITGERGIGKSSLLAHLESLATGTIPSESGKSYNFIVVSHSISDKLDLLSLLRQLAMKLKSETDALQFVKAAASKLWDFLLRIKIADSSIERLEPTDDDEIMLEELISSIASTCSLLVNHETEARDGVLIVLDEADKASQNLRLGYFLKIITEGLSKKKCGNVMFVVCGLPEVRQRIEESHGSALRIFQSINIHQFNIKESFQLIEKAIDASNILNDHVKTAINKEASDVIALLSDGFPHFIQQFGYSAFDYDSDNTICREDVYDSAFCLGGAIDELGRRYYSSDFYLKIRSDDYRQVLTIMAEKQMSDSFDDWIKKSEIAKKFNGNASNLSNALRTLTERNIIAKNPSVQGEYRLQQRGFAIWIRLFGERAKDGSSA